MSKFLDRFRYFKQKGETFADGHGQLSIPTVTGRMDIASVGSMTKSSALPTGSTASAPAAGKSTSKTVWSPGKPSRLTIRVPVRICQTMNLAAARAVPATPGIFTVPTA
ncbi:hypothetical protein ACLK14_07065 [Escherichia coli]